MMNYRKNLAKVMTVTLLTSVASISNAQKISKMTNEQKNVLGVIDKMTTSFNNKDIEGVMSTYESNAIIMFEPETPTSDEATCKKMFQGFFQMNAKFTFYGHEIYITDNIATHITPWKMTATAPDGSVINQKGLSVALLRKQTNGEWLMIVDDPYGDFILNNKTTKEETTEQIKAQDNIDNMTSAFNVKNLDGIMATYEKNASVVFKPLKALSDEKKVRKMFKKFFMVNPNFTFNGHQLIINNNIALHLNPWDMKGKMFGLIKMHKTGLSVVVLRKQSNGEWRMILDNPNGGNLLTNIK